MLYATAIGNLGRDAELRTIPSGKQVLNFSVACKNGREKDSTIWVRCALWGARGEKIVQYLLKGVHVTCIGVLSTREYEGKTQHEMDVQEIVWTGGPKTERSETPRVIHDDPSIPF